MNYVVVAFFAFFGGILRYLLGVELPIFHLFPIGTLTANYIGCFLFSWLVKQIMVDREINGRLILGVGTGFCGGLTTFSSFALDAVQLLQKQAYLVAFLYLFASIVGGLFFVWLGEAIVKKKVSE
ncbi:fluoride efflux transporter CrcB [Enterococcus camelliae]|uniref:Fluoride-specific ion channel FluC n=1 Tax=Enterococcus camelliae TaxID=453959 RepID=A0ABW5TKV7_9ENTE